MALVAGLLLLAALAHGKSLTIFLASSVLAMGALNNVFRRNGEVAIGITYMTGALVRFGQGWPRGCSARTAKGDSRAGGCGSGWRPGQLRERLPSLTCRM